MQVLLAVGEVVRHKQHLRRDEVMTRQLADVVLHQSRLSGGGQGLQRQHVCWPGCEAEGGNANDFKLMPLGQGRNDFPAILAACEDIDAELLVVEQDNFTDITPFEGMAASRKYLKDTFGL
jgi:sugar phosphate isomerase/epimerase